MFAKNTKVKVISGKNAGRRGVVIGFSKRDGYKIKTEDRVIYTQPWYVAAIVETAKPAKPKNTEIKEGDVVRVIKPFDMIESSTPNSSMEAMCMNKHALVTLIYDHDGQKVANIVYQGNYSVAPMDSIVFVRRGSFDPVTNHSILVV
jgi:hypothetical protein